MIDDDPFNHNAQAGMIFFLLAVALLFLCIAISVNHSTDWFN